MILLTGSSGTLGTELQKHIKCHAPFRRLGYDIFDHEVWKTRCYDENNKLIKYNLIIHCAAYTDVLKAEDQKDLCYKTNVIGTRNMASLGIPIIYISTEYVFDGEKGNYSEEDYPNPQNFYSLTKLLGEYEARRSPRSVVIRCLFKPRPFEHDAGCTDQFTSGDYVDVIAKDIDLAVKKFKHLPRTLHIGTGRKSTFELARQTRDVKETTTDAIFRDRGLRLPKDTSLNTSLWERIKNED